MNFPLIRHINDVLPYVKDKSEFIVAEKDHFTVINYVVSNDNTFDSEMARECRGIKFDKNGVLIARPYHKFFNIGEKDQTQPHRLVDRFNEPHLIMKKLDGSMIHPVPIQLDDGRSFLRLCTKMGITDTAMQAEVFIGDKPNWRELMWEMIHTNYTPIFEWMSRDSQIVIDYVEDQLPLVAARNNLTGDYMTYEQLQCWSRDYDVPLAPVIESDFLNIQDFISHTKSLEGEEGYVVYLGDDMVKMKADWYVLRHKSKDIMNYGYKMAQLILNEEVDDVKPFLVEEDLKRLQQMELRVHGEIVYYTDCLEKVIEKAKAFPTRKDFALSEYAKTLDGEVKSAAFSGLDGKTPREIAIKMLLKAASKESTWKEVVGQHG